MKKVVRLPDRPLSPRRAIERIRLLERDVGIVLTRHARLRMAQRKLSRRDIRQCLKYGRVVEHSKPFRWWRYKVQGSTIDGDPMSCVVEINGKLIFITVIR